MEKENLKLILEILKKANPDKFSYSSNCIWLECQPYWLMIKWTPWNDFSKYAVEISISMTTLFSVDVSCALPFTLKSKIYAEIARIHAYLESRESKRKEQSVNNYLKIFLDKVS